MYDIDLESTELCLIDSGIQSLKNVPLGRQLCVLNLHNNAVCRIERLDSLINLKHLDLSSNRIQKLEGLGGLQALRTLNLSCNQIKVVEGLQNLRSLVKLNLSYNLVDDVSGFASVWGSGYKLSHVDLHGNQLNSVTRLVEALTGCDKLRLLTLSQGDSTNPLCHQQDYRSVVLRGLAQLQTLDGVSRDGQEAPATNILADIPGLESYLEYLLSTESGSSESQPAELITPKIDQALERFRNPGISSMDISSVTTGEEVTSEVSQVVSRGNTPICQTGTADSTRLALLEAQLAQLMAKQTSVTNPSPSSSSGDTEKPVAKKVTKLKAKRDIDQTDDSGSETRSRARTPKGQKSRLRKKKSDPPSYQLQTKASQARAEAGVSSSAELADQSESPQRSVSRSPTRRLVSPHTVTVTVPDRRADHGPDQQARENAQSTYLALMKEVESERERRWKAEQAAKKLVDHVKELQHRAKNETSLQETSTQVNTRLKQVLMNEREAKLRLQEQLESANNELRAVREKLDVSREAEQSQRTALQAMEQTAARAESERLKIQAHEGKKVQEAQMRASAASREADILKNSVTTLKGQVQQLQELLATREQEFRAELKGRYTLESKELQDVLERENRKAEKLHLAQQQALQEKIDSLSKQYKDLEDEFRLALQIEANRFTELQSAYELCSQENAANKQSLATSQRKEDRTAAMLADLTALVKEQKGRIAELSKFKQEQTIEYKERVHTLEAHVEEARKRMLQLELTKQEKIKLESQVTAQESVIEGLRAERQLWGQELAQQGASLAQDRGRLDAQIETLKSELSIAKKQLEREADSVQIKTKMLEDQTETIRKLKQALLERDEDVKKAREEGVSVQRQLEAQLLEERTANQELQDSADQLTARKEELKRQVADLEAELEESKRAHGILNKRWKDKSELIGQLEQQVHQMKDTWEAKEQRLTKEKDEAVDRASVAVEKLRSVDDAFRRQLDAKEEQHRVEVAELERQKQAEVDSALQKVVAVEGEMRLLLQETEANKRGMEEKVKRLTQAFSDLQSGLT